MSLSLPYPSLCLIPFPQLSFSVTYPLPLSIPLPLLPLLHTPKSSYRSLGERCKLHQRVRAEPGRQTHFGAVEAKTGQYGARLRALQNG